MKSRSIWKASAPLGMVPVVSPRGVTARLEFHQWFNSGVVVRRIFPTICVHICIASRVSFHSSYASRGHSPKDITLRA